MGTETKQDEWVTVTLHRSEVEGIIQELSDRLKGDKSTGINNEAYYGMHGLKRGRSLLLPLNDEIDEGRWGCLSEIVGEGDKQLGTKTQQSSSTNNPNPSSP